MSKTKTISAVCTGCNQNNEYVTININCSNIKEFKEDLEEGIETYKGVKNTEGFLYKNAFDTLIDRGDFNVEFITKEVLLILDEVSKEEENIRNAISFLVVNTVEDI